MVELDDLEGFEWIWLIYWMDRAVAFRPRVTPYRDLDDTPLLDRKPYVPQFDTHPLSKAGWFETNGVDRRYADGRFHENAEPVPRRRR